MKNSTHISVADLRQDRHEGVTARIGRHTGRLSYQRSPSYPRIEVWHWWLFTDRAAVSLQWSRSEHVELLEPEPAAHTARTTTKEGQ